MLAILAASLPAAAQSPARVFRIGLLSLAAGSEPRADDALLEGLRELGYTEGRNLLVERRYAGAKAERLEALAAELVALRPDVIVAWPRQSTAAAQRATTTIPIAGGAAGGAGDDLRALDQRQDGPGPGADPSLLAADPRDRDRLVAGL